MRTFVLAFVLTFCGCTLIPGGKEAEENFDRVKTLRKIFQLYMTKTGNSNYANFIKCVIDEKTKLISCEKSKAYFKIMKKEQTIS